MALQARVDVAGFGPWSIKGDVPHVQPPVELLGKMLTIRLHLDDADETNGALRVLAGSHRLGHLSSERIQQLRAELASFFNDLRINEFLLVATGALPGIS